MRELSITAKSEPQILLYIKVFKDCANLEPMSLNVYHTEKMFYITAVEQNETYALCQIQPLPQVTWFFQISEQRGAKAP
jgi:hypothetical protein